MDSNDFVANGILRASAASALPHRNTSHTKHQLLGVVLLHLPGELFRAVFSQFWSIFADFSLSFSQFSSTLVSFSQFSSTLVSFSQFYSILVSFSQFWSILVRLYKTKTQKFLTDGKVGRNNTKLGVSRWSPFLKSIRVFSVVGLAVNARWIALNSG